MQEATIDRQEADPGFELAAALLGAWMLADVPLREDLDRAIRAYVRRNPGFQEDLRRALEFNEDLGEAGDAGEDVLGLPIITPFPLP